MPSGDLPQEFILNQDWNDPKSQLQQCCLTLRTEGKEPDIPLYKWVHTACRCGSRGLEPGPGVTLGLPGGQANPRGASGARARDWDFLTLPVLSKDSLGPLGPLALSRWVTFDYLSFFSSLKCCFNYALWGRHTKIRRPRQEQFRWNSFYIHF